MASMQRLLRVRQIFNVVKTQKACMSAVPQPNSNPDIYYNKVSVFVFSRAKVKYQTKKKRMADLVPTKIVRQFYQFTVIWYLFTRLHNFSLLIDLFILVIIGIKVEKGIALYVNEPYCTLTQLDNIIQPALAYIKYSILHVHVHICCFCKFEVTLIKGPNTGISSLF